MRLAPTRDCTLVEKHVKSGDYEGLVRNVRGVVPTVLAALVGCTSPLVKEAFVIHEIIQAMKDTRSVWIAAESIVSLRTMKTLQNAAGTLVGAGVLVMDEQKRIALKWAADQYARFWELVNKDVVQFIQDDSKQDLTWVNELQKGVEYKELRVNTTLAIDRYVDMERLPVTAAFKLKEEVWGEGEEEEEEDEEERAKNKTDRKIMVNERLAETEIGRSMLVEEQAHELAVHMQRKRRPKDAADGDEEAGKKKKRLAWTRPMLRTPEEYVQMCARFPEGYVVKLFYANEMDVRQLTETLSNEMDGKRVFIVTDGRYPVFFGNPRSYTCIVTAKTGFVAKQFEIVLVQDSPLHPDRYLVKCPDGKEHTLAKSFVHDRTCRMGVERVEALAYHMTNWFDAVIIYGGLALHERWIHEAARVSKAKSVMVVLNK
jgi:hypothetical protein